MKVIVAQSCPTPWVVAQAPLSMGFSRQESWSGLQGPPHRAAYVCLKGLPDSSAGKESTCKAGHPGSIPESGRSAGEGIGYPLQYSWASLVAQLVKNPPAMQETWVQSLGWEDPLETESLPTPASWLEEFHGLYSPWGRKESGTTERLLLTSLTWEIMCGPDFSE